MSELDVIRVARYVENSYGEEQGEYMLNKDFRIWLENVLYFLQGYSLKIEGQSLFIDNFILVKSDHWYCPGPILLSVHKELKKTPPKENDNTLDRPFIDEIIVFLSKYSSNQLINAVHESLPWIEAHNNHLTSITQERIFVLWGESVFEKHLIENIQRGVIERKACQDKMNAQKDMYFAKICDSKSIFSYQNL